MFHNINVNEMFMRYVLYCHVKMVHRQVHIQWSSLYSEGPMVRRCESSLVQGRVQLSDIGGGGGQEVKIIQIWVLHFLKICTHPVHAPVVCIMRYGPHRY